MMNIVQARGVIAKRGGDAILVSNMLAHSGLRRTRGREALASSTRGKAATDKPHDGYQA